MDRDQIPLIVEHRRARGAALGIGGVVDEMLPDAWEAALVKRDDLVLAHHHLLVAPPGCWMIETYSPGMPLPLSGISGRMPKSVIGVPSCPIDEMATIVKSSSALV
jgi:hypothetical protein